MTIDVSTVQGMDQKFAKLEPDVIQNWIDLAQPVVAVSGLPEQPDNVIPHGWVLMAAHIGTQIMRQGNNKSSQTMGPLTESFFDVSSLGSDMFLKLYNDLLKAWGLAPIGKNEVHFY
ncbi:hypothetical protein DA477_09370 [Levilactobacillus brevis]|uniref:DUF4054 domain-containing protein n=1 Tax=Levilactobacillus brevis TaxID=1580 RepID=UPI000D38AB40|nr:DUF4054 domain-containing protein [Levilactobacillus brevis]PUD96102.1 hypothetical protein DA477_09370 [Levilactobacillus brevis]